ncbi:MAG: replicative DNA helicase [Rickettsiales bacterium]|nr:replicative DNA helicase [Rickettsiales bacterium]
MASRLSITKDAETDELGNLKEAPNNLEAEQALLGALLTNNDALNQLGGELHPEHFYAEIHRRIYEAILRFHDKGLVANPVTLKHHFADNDSVEDHYLARLVAASATIINVRDYAQIIMDLHLKRELIGLSEGTVLEAYNKGSESSGMDLVEQAEQQLFNLATDGDARGGFQPLRASITEAILRTETAIKRDGSIVGIPTNLGALDRLLGGLNPSDLLILAGRPSMGKTALATSMAYGAALKMKEEAEANGEKPPAVGFFSLEMSGEQLAQRLLASATSIDSSKLQRGELTNEQFAKLTHESNTLAELPFHIDDTPALSIAALRTRARRLKRVHNLGLLIVDYLQLVRPSFTKGSANRVQEISEITQGLKAIAKELNVPVLALSQLSRAVESREDKRPMLSDLRESGSIEQDADVVMFVYREEYYLARSEPKSDMGTPEYAAWQERLEKVFGLADVIVAKQRHGPIGTATLQFQSEFTRFLDYQADEYMPERH